MNWFEVINAAEIPSPALLLFHDRIEANLAEMLRIAGGPGRLRPHIKTHKLPKLVRRQVELGITKFKCATIAEAEMAAENGAEEVLLAYQPVGPQVHRYLQLVARFPLIAFSVLVDCIGAVRELAAANRENLCAIALVDLNVGQNRTGIRPGPEADELIETICQTKGINFGGLHAYDGHLGGELAQREAECERAFEPVWELVDRHVGKVSEISTVILGGSPTFAIHAAGKEPWTELSPGTTVLWDAGYASRFPDLNFLPAAVLLTRVVSKPAPNRLCLDLGHKAVASEMPQPRAVFLNLPDATPVMHSEEHLVVETPHAAGIAVGDVFYALPWHVCPTVALHEEVWVVENQRAADRWTVTARKRRLGV